MLQDIKYNVQHYFNQIELNTRRCRCRNTRNIRESGPTESNAFTGPVVGTKRDSLPWVRSGPTTDTKMKHWTLYSQKPMTHYTSDKHIQ